MYTLAIFNLHIADEIARKVYLNLSFNMFWYTNKVLKLYLCKVCLTIMHLNISYCLFIIS
jgi:hypothetical protein